MLFWSEIFKPRPNPELGYKKNLLPINCPTFTTRLARNGFLKILHNSCQNVCNKVHFSKKVNDWWGFKFSNNAFNEEIFWNFHNRHLFTRKILRIISIPLRAVCELSGSGFESSCSHLNFRFRACFEQGVPWHSGNYRLWIHSKTRTWHDKNTQSMDIVLKSLMLTLNRSLSMGLYLMYAE